MKTEIFKVLGCGNLTQIPSQKAEGGFLNRRTLRLQVFGGATRQDSTDRFSNALIGTLMGKLAQCVFHPGELVVCCYRLSIREYQGNWYQEITIMEIEKLN